MRRPIFMKDGIYHVYNRGHNKQQIFLSYKDYLRYLKRLEEYREKHPVTILAYCLMPNHIHLLARQDSEMEIAHFIHRLHTSYTMYFNKKYERVGSVFQGRFKAKAIESEPSLLQVTRYIHINPLELLRAQGPAFKLESYEWSSYATYIGHRANKFVDPSVVLNLMGKNSGSSAVKYKQLIEQSIPKTGADLLEDISSGNL